MKKNISKLLLVLVLASLAFSSCSVDYRQRHGGYRQDGRDHHDNRGNHY